MNLVIGSTSQQSYYYPEDYIRISSRNIDFNFLKEHNWESVYITFAEQRVYDNEFNSFMNINYFYTLKVIENLISNSNKIVIFTSCELWNNYVGEVKIESPFCYDHKDNRYVDYLLSKSRLYEEILKRRKLDFLYNKIIIIHPFSFNSSYRNKNFLFGKIFDSIINNKKIEIGNTYFYRDIIHTKYLVERVIKSETDEMIGSGRLFHVNDFIRDLYSYFDMDYNYFVTETISQKNSHSEKIYYSCQDKIYTYNMLFDDTVGDLKNKIKNERVILVR